MDKINDVHFYTTTNCNSKCITCNLWKDKRHLELPLDKVIEVVENPILKDVHVALAGGELTLYSDIIPLINYLNEKERKYFFMTNAVSRTLIERIFYETGKVQCISISLDALNEKHDKIRGIEGNYNSVMYIVNWIKTYYPETIIRIGFTVSPYNNKEDFKEVYKYCKDNGIDIKISYWTDAEFFNLEDTKARHNENLYYIGDILPDPYTVGFPLWKNGNLNLPCNGIFGCPYIMSNGDVIICLQKYIILGNVFEKSFEKIWSDENLLKYDFLRQCNDCWSSCFRTHDIRKIYEAYEGKNYWRQDSNIMKMY